MKKKIKIVSIVLLSLLVIGLATASLLTYYGIITATAEVKQSVVLDCTTDNCEYIIGESPIVAGSIDIEEPFTLTNNAEVEATVKLETTCCNETNCGYKEYQPCGGITTIYEGILKLTTKNVDYTKTPWTIPNNPTTATIWYTLTGTEFKWGFVSVSNELVKEYTLIYYKDNSDRFNDPASPILINPSIGSMPYNTDGNIDEYNYCGTIPSEDGSLTGDDYPHCHGAKLWLVPEECLGESGINWGIGCAERYLFETDLIAYSANEDGKITLLANGGGVNFRIVNDFNVALTPDTYTIITKVVPVI